MLLRGSFQRSTYLVMPHWGWELAIVASRAPGKQQMLQIWAPVHPALEELLLWPQSAEEEPAAHAQGAVARTRMLPARRPGRSSAGRCSPPSAVGDTCLGASWAAAWALRIITRSTWVAFSRSAQSAAWQATGGHLCFCSRVCKMGTALRLSGAAVRQGARSAWPGVWYRASPLTLVVSIILLCVPGRWSFHIMRASLEKQWFSCKWNELEQECKC